jgi:hypothetical protein
MFECCYLNLVNVRMLISEPCGAFCCCCRGSGLKATMARMKASLAAKTKTKEAEGAINQAQEAQWDHPEVPGSIRPTRAPQPVPPISPDSVSSLVPVHLHVCDS